MRTYKRNQGEFARVDAEVLGWRNAIGTDDQSVGNLGQPASRLMLPFVARPRKRLVSFHNQ